MGTRSTIKFYENNVFLCCVYQQYDGYIDGVGDELKNFLKSKKLVNGIPLGGKIEVFNGAGCLIAQFIKQFKDKAGGLYLFPEKGKEEFDYRVDIDNWNEIRVCETSDDYPEYAETIKEGREK